MLMSWLLGPSSMCKGLTQQALGGQELPWLWQVCMMHHSPGGAAAAAAAAAGGAPGCAAAAAAAPAAVEGAPLQAKAHCCWG